MFSQSQKYLPSGHLHWKFANPWYNLQLTSLADIWGHLWRSTHILHLAHSIFTWNQNHRKILVVSRGLLYPRCSRSFCPFCYKYIFLTYTHLSDQLSFQSQRIPGLWASLSGSSKVVWSPFCLTICTKNQSSFIWFYKILVAMYLITVCMHFCWNHILSL